MDNSILIRGIGYKNVMNKLGCSPVGEIALSDGTPTHWEKIPDIIQAHKMIKQSGLANF